MKLRDIHNTKVHPDCPFTIEELDEFRDSLLNVATANASPTHPSWAAGHQRHQARLLEREHRRHERLKQLHATALGLYMAARINGQDGAVQKARLERISAALDEYT